MKTTRTVTRQRSVPAPTMRRPVQFNRPVRRREDLRACSIGDFPTTRATSLLADACGLLLENRAEMSQRGELAGRIVKYLESIRRRS